MRGVNLAPGPVHLRRPWFPPLQFGQNLGVVPSRSTLSGTHLSDGLALVLDSWGYHDKQAHGFTFEAISLSMALPAAMASARVGLIGPPI